jgi:hypothetical protein
MRTSFEETEVYKLNRCGKCLLAFYVPETLLSGSRWNEPVWCPACGKNSHGTPREVESLRRQNAGLRGCIARMKKGKAK